MARSSYFSFRLWSISLVLFDLIALFACGLIATALCGYSVGLSSFTISDRLLVAIICWAGLAIGGGYEGGRNMGTLRYFSEHVLAMAGVLVASYLLTYVVSTFNSPIKPGRSVLLLTLILFTPLSLTYRYNGSKRMTRSAASRFIYLIASPELASELKVIFQRAHFSNPIRLIRPEEAKHFFHQNDGLVLPKAEGQLPPIFYKDQCEAVVVDLSSGKEDPEWQALLLDLNFHSVPVYPVYAYIESHLSKIALPYVTLSWALDGTFKADHHTAYGNLKAVLDFIFGGFLFLLLIPLLFLIALMIRLESSGPVLFKQVRIGRFGRPFFLYKFRTMRVTDKHDQKMYTLKDDGRITKVGRFLRLTRVDELPQLWNVMRGHMSMIGPRAEWNKLVEQYEKEIPYYHLRHMVKPGITGWAQVNYGYGASAGDAREKLEYDLFYIKHYSLQMDASIVLKTIFTILSASGR
jgi:exopolysaccharide biosynthesis polyprenyl glycosylphosphotransferase